MSAASLRRIARGTLPATLFPALVLGLGGCWGTSPAPPAPAQPTAATASNGLPKTPGEIVSAAEPVSTDAQPETDAANEIASPTEASVATDAVEGDASASGETSETTTSVEDAPSTDSGAAWADSGESAPAYEPTARLLVATPGGPTIVDVALIVDGETPEQALAEFVDEILKLADTNADGSPTWDEVFANAVFKAGTLGNDAIPGEPEAQRARELYDTNRDNVVQRDEVPRFVTRNAGAARPFTLQSANYFRFYQKTESALRLILDRDRDGKLTREELAGAAGELAVFDADDDEILTSDEIEMDDRESFRRQRPLNARTDPETALLVDDRLKTEQIRGWLSETYAFSGSLESGIFPRRPDLETTLDANADGQIDAAELEALRTLPADVVVRAEFGADQTTNEKAAPANVEAIYRGQGGGGTRVSVLTAPGSTTDEGSFGSLSNVRTHTSVPSRAVLELDGVSLRIAANDGAPSTTQAEGVFRQADANGDGSIDKTEREASPFLLQIPAEAVDLDGDDAYSLEETTGYFRRIAGSQRAKVRGLAMEDRDALLVALDRNLDGRLQPGERQEIEGLLERYDANADDQVSVGELPAVVSLIFIRGDLQQSEELFRQTPERVSPQNAGEAPLWLIRMDRNEDGVVTRREFPGPPEKFQQLDQNGDGEVVAAEAIAAESDSQDE